MAKKQIKPLADEKKREQFQSVWITFSDGTRAGFTGAAVASPGDKRHIIGIQFTEPKDLPPGCVLEAMGETK